RSLIKSAACPVELTWPRKLIGASTNKVTSACALSPGRNSREIRMPRALDITENFRSVLAECIVERETTDSPFSGRAIIETSFFMVDSICCETEQGQSLNLVRS